MGAAPTQATHDQSGTEAGPLDRSIRARSGPLAGVRVADFCWMGVGSVATRLLADFGAEVIKIEDRIRIDTPRRLRGRGNQDRRSHPDRPPAPAATLQERAGPQLRRGEARLRPEPRGFV